MGFANAPRRALIARPACHSYLLEAAARNSMGFLHRAGVITFLVTLTLAVQSAGMGLLIYWGRAHFEREMRRFSGFRSTVLLVRFTAVMIALHSLQIVVWAGFYRWNCLPSWESAFYFSAATYSTVGAGDILLPQMWRTLGPMESVTGVLMCGLSASFLFAIVTRLIERAAPELANEVKQPVEPVSTGCQENQRIA